MNVPPILVTTSRNVLDKKNLQFLRLRQKEITLKNLL